MDKPFSRFTGQILPDMPDIVQVIKSTTANLSHVRIEPGAQVSYWRGGSHLSLANLELRHLR